MDTSCEKGAQISVVAKKIVTQGWSEIMIMKYKRAAHYIYFLFCRCYVYIMLPIWCKSWNRVYWLLLFLIRIKFGHAQISVPKIGVPISKIACINPWLVTRKNIEKDKCLGEILNDARQKNINQPIIGQLNINSIRKNFNFLESEASKHLGITHIWNKDWWVIFLGTIFAEWIV